MKKLLIILVCSILVGCGSNIEQISDSVGYLTSLNYENLNTEDIRRLNIFSFDLYNNLSNDQNIFISPASIYLTLGMTYNGANNETSKQMAKLLNIEDLSIEEFNKMNYNLQSLILLDNGFKLSNSLWINKAYSNGIKQNFIDLNSRYYGTMISKLDFNDIDSYKKINDWVKKNTDNKFKNIIEEKIDTDTILYLVNTIYFKNNWLTSFDENETYKSEFKTLNGDINVAMMHKIDNVGYVENENLQGIILPYENNKTSMFIILPKTNINDLNFSLNNLDYLLNEMRANLTNVDIKLPKLDIEYTISLNNCLKELGMYDAFSETADFSNMIENTNLNISNIIHKNFLKIDENGTEAASSTVVEATNGSFNTVNHSIIINHPFILGIINNETNGIIFMGNIYRP